MSETVTRIGKPYDENDPSTYRRLIWTTLDNRPVEVEVTPTQTRWIASNKSNVSELPQLESAVLREINVNKADDKVHKLFGAKSWGEFLASLALGTATAFGGYAAYPILTSPYVAQPLNAYFTYQVGKELLGENGIPKTYNHFKNGDYEAGIWSATGDVTNAALGALGTYSMGKQLKDMGLRTLEVGMRNVENVHWVDDVINDTKKHLKDAVKLKNIKQNPLLRNLDYIVTGNRNHLTSITNNPFAPHGYTGLRRHTRNADFAVFPESDAITAYLYGDDLPKELFTKIQTGGDLDIFNNYVAKNYSRVRDRIPTYEGELFHNDMYMDPVPKDTPKTILKVEGRYGNLPSLKKDIRLDAGGHNEIYAIDQDGKLMAQSKDIWKFNPSDYARRYDINKPLKYTLGIIDRVGTPFITLTPWLYIHPNAYQCLGYDQATRSFIK